ncbi:leucyl aminopeptidase [Undibacterium amnicola]|uniref:Probable cytosol aminopeptidase n=1 Tax=Undibacterium amnicola TaxID=1834038 RepID=A0ABR6XP93_9BURK|nr:leucyl aminopeptidase [Undibacterium amnicola]
MDFSIKTLAAKSTAADNASTIKTACIVVGVFENKKLSTSATQLNKKGAIDAALKSGDISGKVGSTLMLRNLAEVSAERVLLVGLGDDPNKVSEKAYISAVQNAARGLNNLGGSDVSLVLPEVDGRDLAWAIRQAVIAFKEAIFRTDAHKSKKDTIAANVKKVAIYVAASEAAAAKVALAQSIALVNGMELTKELGNMPANFCTPTHLANTAKKIAADFKMGVEVLERKQIQALKMNSFLSVSAGTDEPPKFIVLKHMGGKAKDAPIVLVGKGITFDSGGISLKPGAGMDEMKYDMGGAGSVLGTMRAIGEMKLKLNVIAVIPTCENMPSGSATRPGDIVTSMSGQTIEVLNTDAEGRLILCDALTYVERFKPAAVIDVATLTGAIITSLGHHTTGLFTRHDDTHDKLAEELLSAGKQANDVAWRLPIGELYNEQLKSNFADIANIGGPAAGSITAACFLERFTKKYTWAHLDIAGVSWKSGAAKGSTGRPVPMLTTFLMNRAG